MNIHKDFTNLFALYMIGQDAADNDDTKNIIYLEFSKTFDTLDHKRVLGKTKANGIEGKVWNWIRAWLSCTEQRGSS